MGYNDYGPSRKEILQILHNFLFIVGIQCIRCFVKKQIIGVLVYGAGNQYALFLPLAYPNPFRAYLRIKSVGYRFHKRENIGGLATMHHSFIVHRFLAYSNITGNGITKNIAVLHYRCTSLTPEGRADVFEIRITDLNFSFIAFIKLQKQLYQGGFTTAPSSYLTISLPLSISNPHTFHSPPSPPPRVLQ